MRKFDIIFISLVLTLSLIGCVPHSVNRPDVEVYLTLPTVTKFPNEKEIAGNFAYLEPNLVIGKIINLKNSQVMPLEGTLINEETQPKVKFLNESVFRKFVEITSVSSNDWLNFVKDSIGKDTKAEISVTRVSSTYISPKDIDKEKIEKFTAKISSEDQNNYGVIIGYIEYVLSASFFRDSAAEGKLGAYGAQIGGKWFNRIESSATDHRLTAIWSPFPIIKKTVAEKQNNSNASLPETVRKQLGSIGGVITLHSPIVLNPNPVDKPQK